MLPHASMLQRQLEVKPVSSSAGVRSVMMRRAPTTTAQQRTGLVQQVKTGDVEANGCMH